MNKLLKTVPTIADAREQAMQYDEYQEKMHGEVYAVMREKIVECITLSIARPLKILDCGTGTGDIAIRIAKRFPDVFIVGIDASNLYLQVAHAKINALGFKDKIVLENINFQKGIPKRTGKFDIVVSQYVFHYWPIRATLFKSINAALRPFGKLAFGISILSRDPSENSKWFTEKEKNACRWYKNHGFDDKIADIKSKADRMFLERYMSHHCVRDPIQLWLSELECAGFESVECVWQNSLDVIIQAIKPDNARR